MENVDCPAHPPDDNAALSEDDGTLDQDSTPLHEDRDAKERYAYNAQACMRNPW